MEALNIPLSPTPPATRAAAGWPQKTAGFTLMEIIIAVGIIGFALTALLGLMSMASRTSRDSATDTTVSSMTRQIVAELRTTPFSNLAMMGTQTDYFFDHEARRLFLVQTPGRPPITVPLGAIYRCRAFLSVNPAFNGLLIDRSLQPNLYEVQIECLELATAISIQSVHTSVARYE